MSVSVAGGDALRLHAALEERLASSAKAEGEAFVIFIEIYRRELYRELGCGSIYHYAEEKLGFSSSKTAQFVRLTRSFESLPKLFEAVRTGGLHWTKARIVAGVATPETEARWIESALRSSRRALSKQIDLARSAARQRARRTDGQQRLDRYPTPTDASPPAGAHRTGRGPYLGPTLAPSLRGQGSPGDESSGAESPEPEPPSSEGSGSPKRRREVRPAPPDDKPNDRPNDNPSDEPLDVPLPVTFRFTPEQFARYSALVEALRKSGRREPREELVLASLADALDAIGQDHEAAAEKQSDAESGSSRAPSQRPYSSQRRARSGVRYRIVTYTCEACGRAHIPTPRGNRAVPMEELEAQLGSAEIVRPGKRKRHPIRKRLRERVLARDGHRCQCAGCSNTRFLDVHHRVPIAKGGTNRMANLITLCHACHRALHQREGKRLQQHTRVQNLRAELGLDPDPGSMHDGEEGGPQERSP